MATYSQYSYLCLYLYNLEKEPYMDIQFKSCQHSVIKNHDEGSEYTERKGPKVLLRDWVRKLIEESKMLKYYVLETK